MKNIFGILGIMIFSVSVQAQQRAESLKQLISQSFTYFPKFKELGEQINESEHRVLLAKSGNKPVLSAQGSYRYMDPVSVINIPTGSGTASFQIMPNNNYSTMLNASYVLWDFGAVKAAVESAKASLESSKHNLAHQQNEMAFQVSSIYYQAAYLKGAVAIEQSVIEFLEDNKKDTEARLRNGDALRYDVLSIQSSIDQENNRKIALQNSLDKQLALLEYTTGGTIDVKSADFGFQAAIPADEAQSLAYAQKRNSEFDLIRDRIKQAETQVGLFQSRAKPSVLLSAGTGYTNGYTPDIDKFRYNYNAGVTLRIPIYEGGKAREEISIAKSQLASSHYAQEALENTFLKDIRQAQIDIQSNTSSIINSRQQVIEALEAQKLAQSRYKNGIGTYLELTGASTNVQRAELANLQYEFQLCIAHLSLARLTGLRYWE